MMRQIQYLVLAMLLAGVAAGGGCATFSAPCGCTYDCQQQDTQPEQIARAN